MNCDICGVSDNIKRIRTIKGMNLCPKHITQLYRHSKFLDKTIYDNNEYIKHDDYFEIIIRDKSCEEVGRAIIDAEDYDICAQHKWHIKKSKNTNYAISHINGKKVFLHRFVLDYYGNKDVDHINRNGMDNRKSNLRITSHSDNIRNQSETRKGIKKVKSGKYQATITKNYKCIYLGTFDTYESALEARIRAENEI